MTWIRPLAALGEVPATATKALQLITSYVSLATMMRSRANTDPGSPAWSSEAARRRHRKKKIAALKATSKSSKDTKLLAAVMKGQVREAAVLLKRGASAGAQAESTGDSPLHLACSLVHEQSALLVSMLLQHGASANARAVSGRTPVHCCARSGNISGLKALLLSAQGHVEMDPEDSDGCTPAKLALLRDHTDCFELLLQHGADPMKTDDTGAALLHFAAAVDCWKGVQLLCERERTIDLDFQDAGGSTALHAAARSGSIASVASLLGVGADWKVKDHEGHTAEFVANLNNQDTIASMLRSCEEVDKTLGVDLSALPPPRLHAAVIAKENATTSANEATAVPTHLPPAPRCPSKDAMAGADLPPPLPMSPRSAALQAPPSLQTPTASRCKAAPAPIPPSRSRALQQRRMQASHAASIGLKLPPPPQRKRVARDDVECRNGSPARTRRAPKRARPSSMYIKAPASNIPQTFGGYGYIPPMAPLPPRRCT